MEIGNSRPKAARASALPDSKLIANNNDQDGIFVATGSLSVFGGAFAGTGDLATINASHNGGSGITIALDGTMVSPFGAAKIIIKNNARDGLTIAEGGRALLIGGLTVQHNQTGLLGDGAGTITLVSIPPNPSAITNNGTDVDLKFGTRVTFDGVTIGTITCDATVLSRDAAGNPVCP